MSRWLHSAASVGLSLLAILTSTAIAFAHAQYDSSTPPSSATVSAVPSAVQVTYTQELASIRFTITGPDGSDVVAGPATIDLAHRKNASVPIRGAGPGQYLVVWHNVSGDDGDPNDGSFVFTVAGTPAQTTAPAQPSPAAQPTAPTRGCPDTDPKTPGIADVRVDTYCKRQAIRDQYRGKIDEKTFNYDLSVGMGLESALDDAMDAMHGS